MRALAFAFVITLSASASAEDWSRYIDHGDDTASMPAKASQPRANASQSHGAAKTPAKAYAAKPAAKPAAKARVSRKPPRK
jgi:hypothetical protein